VLRKLATSTGGRYVVAGSTGDIPALIQEAVQGMDVFEMEAGETRVLVEFYQWAVLPGIFFLMAAIVAGTRWRKLSLAVFVGMLFIFPDGAQAGELGDAKRAFKEGRYDEARDSYRNLATLESGDDAARLRLAEGLSAYEAKDMRGARSAYSEALLSRDKSVLAEAHEGLGNTLFQLGWMGLSGNRYPSKNALPSMEDFDAMVRDQLQKMGEEELPESGDTHGYIRIEAIMINWADAIRHYRSALINDPKDRTPSNNEEMTMAYLKRLAELLKEEKEQTEQEMQQMPQQGDPQEGEGNSKQKPKEGEGGDNPDPEKGDKGDKDDKGDKGDQGDKPDDKDKGDKEKDAEGNPNESPEDKARRLLKENSDVEKGPLSQGRRGFRIPDKDW
jgi:tetratricopeptide (TPR) repeat protein